MYLFSYGHMSASFLYPTRYGSAVRFKDKLHDAIDATKLSTIRNMGRDILAVVDMKRLMHDR
jgi:hypothetical protein